MTFQIQTLPGFPADMVTKLGNINVRTTDDLLKLGENPETFKNVATKTGIEEREIRKWIGTADLMRVKGIVPQVALMLQQVGMDSVEKLAEASPITLAQSLADYNVKHKVVAKLPTTEDVKGWLTEAKQLHVGATR